MALWDTWAKLRDEFVKHLKHGVRVMVGQRSDLGTEVAAVVVGTDGDIHPFRAGGDNGQSAPNNRTWTQRCGVYGTNRTGTESLYNGPCKLLGLIVTTTTVATAVGAIRDGGAAGTTKFSPFFNTLGTFFYEAGDAEHATDVYFTAGTAWAGNITAVVDPAV